MPEEKKVVESQDKGTQPQAPEQPVKDAVQQPVAQQPAAQQPAARQPVAQQPVAQQPAAQKPLPADTKDRTREQFEKLLDNNRKLFESNESMRQKLVEKTEAEQTFAPIQNVPQAQQQPVEQQVDPRDFVEKDPVTGESYINEQKLKAKLAEIQQRAFRAEKAVKNYITTSEKREVEKQEKETYESYPELNPLDKDFNKKFNREVRGVLLDSMFNADDYGGKPLTFKEAAEVVKTKGTQTKDKQGKKTDEKGGKEASEELKEQVAAQPDQQPAQKRDAPVDEELEDLRKRTRYGDSEALVKRIMNTEHIRKDEE